MRKDKACRLTLFVLLVLSLWPTVLKANKWVLFVSTEGGFSIMAPKPPVERPTLPHSGVFEFNFGEGSGGAIVTYADTDKHSWNPWLSLEEMGGRVVFVGRHEGREHAVMGEDGVILALGRAFCVGKRYYQVDAYGASQEDMRRFVESFKLLGAR